MDLNMMTSWYGNAFRIVREIAGIHQWLVDSPEKGSVIVILVGLLVATHAFKCSHI